MKWLRNFANNELVIENSILRERLNKLEANYDEIYMKGFSHGIDIAYKYSINIEEKLINKIKSQAIQETLDRMNGNHKKNN